MNLLLTNDDGFNAEGLVTLANELSKEHNVYVLAPSSNRSAVSHCITMYQQLELKKIDENVWACSGFPADCVFTAIRSELFSDVKFDAVISGINKGPNMGTDIIYSGTCSGARQGALFNIPSIALSVDSHNKKFSLDSVFDYQSLATFVRKNLNKLIEIAAKAENKVFLNINAPTVESYKGVKFCNSLCKRNYGDSIELMKTNDEKVFNTKYILGNGRTEPNCDDDFSAINAGYIAISGVNVEPNCSSCLEIVDCNSFSV